MPDVDLSLVSVDDLMKEIHTRFDVWVFSGMQLRGGKNNNMVTSRKWAGNSAACAGLASQLQVVIFDQHVENCLDDNEPFET